MASAFVSSAALVAGPPAVVLARALRSEEGREALIAAINSVGGGPSSALAEQVHRAISDLGRAADAFALRPPREAPSNGSPDVAGAEAEAGCAAMDTVAAADYLGVTTSRVRQLARSGTLGTKPQGRWEFTRAELAAHRARLATPPSERRGKRETPAQ